MESNYVRFRKLPGPAMPWDCSAVLLYPLLGYSARRVSPISGRIQFIRYSGGYRISGRRPVIYPIIGGCPIRTDIRNLKAPITPYRNKFSGVYPIRMVPAIQAIYHIAHSIYPIYSPQSYITSPGANVCLGGYPIGPPRLYIVTYSSPSETIR